MKTFTEYIKLIENVNTSFTSTDEKLNQIARRIWANATAQANQSIKKREDFKNFQVYKRMSDMAVYDWLTQRMSGREEATAENNKEATNMALTMANAPAPPGAQYSKGLGWHHWIVNGDDLPRGDQGTNKTYISVHYKTLLPQAQNVMSAILRNLVANDYKGQIKINASGRDGWLDRSDNIVLHSSSKEWAQFGANIVVQVLNRFGVKIGGNATSGNVEQGLDPKGTGESFNSFVSKLASRDLIAILNNTNSHDQFMRNVQNHFKENGPFVQMLKNTLK
jgi:hypothetical protein